jgi:hypothetical protein
MVRRPDRDPGKSRSNDDCIRRWGVTDDAVGWRSARFQNACCWPQFARAARPSPSGRSSLVRRAGLREWTQGDTRRFGNRGASGSRSRVKCSGLSSIARRDRRSWRSGSRGQGSQAAMVRGRGCSSVLAALTAVNRSRPLRHSSGWPRVLLAAGMHRVVQCSRAPRRRVSIRSAPMTTLRSTDQTFNRARVRKAERLNRQDSYIQM